MPSPSRPGRNKLRAADPEVPVAVLAEQAEPLPAALEDPHGDWVYARLVPTAEQVAKVHRSGRRVFRSGPLVSGREPENWRKARDAHVDATLTDLPLDCRQEMKRLHR